MPVGSLIVIGFIVAVFAIFILVLAAVTWWSEQAPRRLLTAADDEPKAHSGRADLKS